MLKKSFFVSFILVSSLFLIYAGGECVSAAEPDVDVKILAGTDFSQETNLDILSADYVGSARITVVNNQIVVSEGDIDEPVIKVFDFSGNLIREFEPFSIGKLDAVSIAPLISEGKTFIVVGAGAGSTAQVRIFGDDGMARYSNGFLAEDVDYKKGIEVTGGKFTGGKTGIVTVSLLNKTATIRIFDVYGNKLEESFSFQVEDGFLLPRIATYDYDKDGVDEIVVGGSSGNLPYVKIFNLKGELLKEFLAYGESFRGGINISTGMLGAEQVIVTAAGYSGGPHIRIFNGFGLLISEKFAYGQSFRGGVDAAYSDSKLFTVPAQLNFKDSKYVYKYIDIDISEQKLRYFQNGKMVNAFTISSGRVDLPTPYGEYKILNKISRAYSKKYDLYMPYWMAFRKDGYGLHELPEWKNGYKEGRNHLGLRVSHGCVRLGVGPAKMLYDWATVGTPVSVHK